MLGTKKFKESVCNGKKKKTMHGSQNFCPEITCFFKALSINFLSVLIIIDLNVSKMKVM